MKSYEFSQAGLALASVEGGNNEVLLMGAELVCMVTVGLLAATSGMIVIEAAYPITGVIGKLATSGFAFRTLLKAL